VCAAQNGGSTRRLRGGIDFPRNEQEYRRWFRAEEQARAFMERLRWPGGFVCPECRSTGRKNKRELWRCSGCHRQFSVTAGTIFDGGRLGPLAWLHACWLVAKGKDGYSALDLQRQLGVQTYETAWAILQKLRRAMVVPGREKLGGMVEVDDAFIGGEEPGVSGRETYTKSVVMVAVQLGDTLPNRRRHALGRLRLAVIPDQTGLSVEQFVLNSVREGSHLVTDGSAVFQSVAGPWPDDPEQVPRYRHTVHVQKGRRKDDPHRLPHVHRVVALVKRWLLGTHQGAVRQRHLDAYLDEFVFRFNRKNLPRGFLFHRLVEQALRTPPIPTRKLYLNVPARHVQPVYSLLERRGFPVVITGGWAVDGVAQQVIRVHGDLDLLVPARYLQAARRYLMDAGILPVEVAEGDRHQYVDDEHGLAVSLHPVEMRRGGSAVETLPDGQTFEYRPEDLDGQGILDGYSLPCVTAEAQFRRRGLDRERDEERHDLRVLRRVIAGELPALNRDPKEAEEEHLPDVTEEDEVVAFPEDGRE
jgi:transposase-like protein